MIVTIIINIMWRNKTIHAIYKNKASDISCNGIYVRVTHDDASSVALGDLIGAESGLEVIEAEPALRAEPSPVAVVVAVEAGTAGLVAHLQPTDQKKKRMLINKE